MLREPAGIDDPIVLPVVKGSGVSLRASKARFDHTDPITVAVASTKDTPVTVGLFVREGLHRRPPARSGA